MKFFKKVLSTVLAASLLMGSVAVDTTMVSAAPSISGGWYESIYAEWKDSNPDAATVEYKLSSDSAYTALEGNDAEFLIRKASASGYGRVDIPGLKAGTYDIKITASDGAVHERKGIKVLAHDRSGYAHWTTAGPKTYQGVGAYNNDGTLKDNAKVVYVTEENKNTVEVPGYEGKIWDYKPSSGSPYTRNGVGIGNILNNNMKLVQEVTITDNHPLVIRLIGKVTVPDNLTPYDAKDPILGGSKGDNGNLAITKYARNVTIEGIGDDAEVDGWGFTFSQTGTCPTQAGESFEVRNLTFRNYTEDALGFQGDDAIKTPIRRVWVHNNVFYPGHASPTTDSDKSEGDGSCDFKRGQYYTMSYNHYIQCHKTNLLGAGDSDDQFFMTLHHNWYESVASRQPLAAGGNVHIYNTFFQDKMSAGKDKHDTSTVIDLRGHAAGFSENNYFQACKNYYNLRKNTSNLKAWNDKLASITVGGKQADCTLGKTVGTLSVANSRGEKCLPDNGLYFPDGVSIANWDTNPKYFYCDASGNTIVDKLDKPEDVPTEVQTYAGTLHEFPQVESGTVRITVKDDKGAPVTDASVTASGLSFSNMGSGVYEATCSLYSEYGVTVSKEGYENVVISTKPIETDGGVFEETATLKPDTDGYAVVKLTGGSDNAPINGATVTLDNGDKLSAQGEGIYKSAVQYPVGERTVTITGVGNYIEPAAPQKIAIKTTNAATEIHLDKAQGDVTVTIEADKDSTATLDATAAMVYVGTKKLDYAGNNTFTGKVDVGTSLAVTASVPGWQVANIEPAQIIASTGVPAKAVITVKEGGDEYVWNYTTGENTADFYDVSANNWNSADSHVQTSPDGESLTKAVKMESSTSITFTAPSDGDLIMIMYGGSGRYVLVNGQRYDIKDGANTIPIKAGPVEVKKGSSSTYLYYMKFIAGGGGSFVPPTPGEGTTAAPDESTEATTSAPVQSTPVDKGDAQDNSNGGSISVTYDAATDSYKLHDTDGSNSAKLNIPLKETIKSGKVVVRGTATPTKKSGSWALVSVTGPAGADGTYPEIAALASDGNKNLTLRVNGDKDNGYSVSTDALVANKTYEYEFIIDLDNASVTLTVDGNTYTSAVPITTKEVGGFASITASKDTDRDITVSNPYIGIVEDTPPAPPVTEGLNDEYMWAVDTDLVKDDYGMIELGEAFLANSEEDAAAEFTEGDKTYELWDWVQPKNNPTDSRGQGPMSENTGNGDPTGIPVSGGYLKFTPKADGALTAAIKTNTGKATYITDEAGTVVYSKDQTNGSTSYDIVRINVKQGKSYYIFANGSKTCIYYLGYTSGKTVEEPSSEGTTNTEPSSEETTKDTSSQATTNTEPSSEETTLPPVKPDMYGDADANGQVEINDVVDLLGYALKGIIKQVNGGVITPSNVSSVLDKLDVSADGKLDTTDVAVLLQKMLDSSYEMPIQKKAANK